MTFVAGCELPQKPGELWWDVDLNVPFGVRQYGIWELADPDSILRRDGSGIGMDDDSSVYFSAWGDLSAGIGDSLYVKSVDLSITRYVTAIEAPLDYDTLLNFTLGILNPGIADLHGTIQNIAPHELSGQIVIPLPTGYDSMKVDTGAIKLIVANRLPYSATNVEIRAGGKVVAEFDTLVPDQQAVLDGLLDNAEIRLVFPVTLHATGMGGINIAIDSTDRLAVSMRVDTVTVNRFYGFTPEQTVTKDSALAIDQQHDIDVAIISEGEMTLTVSNRTQFPDTVTLFVPNLISRLNDTLTVKQFLMPGDSHIVVVPLAQYRLRPSGQTNQTITARLISHSPAATEPQVFIGDGEIVYGRIEISQLSVEYFSGTLHGLALTFDSLTISIDRPPQGWEVLRPLDVEARIHVDHGIGGELDAVLSAHTSLNDGEIDSAVIVVAGLPLVDDTVTVITGLENLLADYPDEMMAHGSATLSGEVAVFNNSVVEIAIEMRAALEVVLLDTLAPVGEIERVDPQDLEEIASGEATITLWNHLPLGGRCYMVADYDSARIADGSTADVDTLFDVTIPRPTIQNGRAVGSSEYEFIIELDQRWLDYFAADSFYVRTQILVSTGIGDTMIAHGSDYLSVRAFAKLAYTIRPGEVQ